MTLKKKLYIIIFTSRTKAARLFDILLLWVILLSVLTVILESIPSLGQDYPLVFNRIEWLFTILFTVEYILRIGISPKPFGYIFSFWGIIDLLAAIPMYFSLIFPGIQFIFVIRLLRFLRVFRILKIARFTNEARVLSEALKSSLYKITIFLTTILILVLLLGTLMYVVEGKQQGFSSIPQSIYWAIVTITTVGYGDLVPQTMMGKFISSVIMITGYAIIAVPTGIVTSEMAKKSFKHSKCENCGWNNPETSFYCNHCGRKLQ
jgi:voltage-gated potassium channel